MPHLCTLLCSFINKIKILFTMCSENKNFHIVSQIVFAPWSVFRLRKAAARRHQHILTAWPSISSSKELELSDFDRELGTASAAFTLSWHRWMNPRSWKKKLIWLIGIFDAVGIFSPLKLKLLLNKIAKVQLPAWCYAMLILFSC